MTSPESALQPSFVERYYPVIKVLLVISILFYIYSLFYRVINIDEPMLGEHAYFLATEGNVKAILFTGTGWEFEQFHYHKLYIVLGAVLIKLFGFSLYVLKSLSLIFYLIFFWFLYRYYIGKNAIFTTLDFVLCFFLIFINARIFEWSFLFRPEIMLMTLCFASYFYLEKWLQHQKNSYLFLTSVLAGVSILTHLNGAIVIIAGFLILAIHRHFKEAIIFGCIASLVSLAYFFNINSLQEFQIFWGQFSTDPNLEKSDFSIFSPLVKIFEEHKRYFHSPKEWSFTILFIVVLASNFKDLRRNHSVLLTYLLILAISLGAIAHGKTAKYALVLFPFVVIIITTGLKYLYDRTKPVKYLSLLVLFVYIGIHSFYIGDLIKQGGVDYTARNERIAKYMPEKGSNVNASSGFLFNQILNYNVQSPLPLWYSGDYKASSEKRDYFFDFARATGSDYIMIDFIYDDEFIEELFSPDQFVEGETLYDYEVVANENDFVVLKNINDLSGSKDPNF